MKVYLDKVDIKQKNILYRLLEYSLFEESLNDLNEMNNDGLFEYPDFNNYFNNEGKEAYFIRELESNKLLGFVMINIIRNKNVIVHCIEEFMVIPKYRKNKIGKKIAFMCFDMYKGIWKISPSFNSQIAFDFWKNVINEYTTNLEYKNGTFVFNNN